MRAVRFFYGRRAVSKDGKENDRYRFLSVDCGRICDPVLCPHTLPFAILAQIIKLHGVSMFWTIVYSMTYDIAEVDEFKNGSRREGLLTSVNSFFMKLGVSVGMGAAGISLDLIHFDPTKSVQGEQMLQNLSSMIMFVPMAIAVLGILICRQYKITKENHRLLKEALRRRQEGLPYATEGIEEITK